MSSSRAAQKSKLEELRKLRTTKKTRLSSYRTQDEQRLFDEVDEDEYKKVQRSRLDEDDFVVDDDGEGYVENGVDEWGTGRDYHEYSSSDDNNDISLAKIKGKRKRQDDKAARQEQVGTINKYFNSLAAQAGAKPKAESTAEDKEFLNNLLGQLDETQSSFRTAKKLKAQSQGVIHRRQRSLSPSRAESHVRTIVKEEPLNSDPDIFIPSSPPRGNNVKEDVVQAHVTHDGSIDKPTAENEQSGFDYSELDDRASTDELAVRPILKFSKARDSPINLNAVRPQSNKPTKETDSEKVTSVDKVDAKQWQDVTANLSLPIGGKATEQPALGKLGAKDVVEADGSMRFFWIDYTEIGGCLCLFGKVRVKGTSQYASAFIKINGIMRKLYFLPRVTKPSTGDEVEMADVYGEVDELFSKLKISQGSDWKAKSCKRKYAFELSDIPKESDYLKVLYPYDKPQVQAGTTGETFSHVFGTGTSIFEQFVLARNIMGPCWLDIKEPIFSGIENASWCKLELQVASPSKILPPIVDNQDPPPFKLMSLAIRTKINQRESKPEIVAITGRVYENMALDETSAPETIPSRCFTICRPVGKSFPLGFQAEVERHPNIIKTGETEASLLGLFLAKLQSVDPDALVGHDLEESIYGTLIHRLKECKIPNWHRIGRIRRGQWPNNLGRGGYFAERQILAGRLMCDISNDLGKSLMSKCQSWSLTEISDLILGKKRIELDNEAVLKSWAASGKGFLNYIEHAETDTFMIAAIALRIQIMPLAKQLTNLAGNSWARTMSGTRAERNEYILLHEFTNNKYICPDKAYDKGKIFQREPGEDAAADDDDTPLENSKKKDKFKGGLVLEPERGLYDRFVLVMDFNSLYPSIIQEFNICFTTVERADLPEDQVPEVPKEQVLGIFPKLIATLVDRRRQVKSLMKDKNATSAQLAQWDIKQQALKLTANSMYGCLGYVRSRFYARPLAMLTTFQGREILRSTKELAESLMLRVIYGDTDSVMINTNVDNYANAIKIGNDFKKAVNERYRLLEIDIDNVFQRLLLHSKKKYAALNYSHDGRSSVEVKGLDMRRREYCQISKDVSSAILKEILSGDDPDKVIERIHDYLRNMAQQIRDNIIPINRYTIYTKISKDPELYPSGKTMPQVQVALRRRTKGEIVKANDVISFIVTGDGNEHSSPAERAFSPQEIKADPSLKPDPEWYLAKQIFPPVERLCGPIDGTDAIRLAECLGLDTRKYQIAASTSQAEQDIHPLESTLSDEERFRDTQPLLLTCLGCNASIKFEGLLASSQLCTFDGINCTNKSCGKPFGTAVIIAQVEANIRNHTSRYYESWLQCNDASCENRTRQISVYGKTCLGSTGLAKGCSGVVGYEYTDKMLYTQLLYLHTLFDVERAKEKASGADKESVLNLVERYRKAFGLVNRVILQYQKKCGRSWVQMDNIFTFT